APVLGGKAEYGQPLDAERLGPLDRAAQRRDPRPVPESARQPAVFRPAAVAVHDDGHVERGPLVLADRAQRALREGALPRGPLIGAGRAGHVAGLPCRAIRRGRAAQGALPAAHTCMISCSLVFKASSTRCTASSVSFCTSCSSRL